MKKAVGYVRVSTDKQEAENQKSAINEACAREGYKVEYITEVISSRKNERKVYDVVETLKEGETLIVYEASRLARSISQMFEITQKVKRQKAGLWILKPEIRINPEMEQGDGPEAMKNEMLLFAISVASAIERNLISERTKNALKKRKEEGMKLGRPEGKGQKIKKALKEKGMDEKMIERMIEVKTPASAMGRLLGVDPRTMREYLKCL